MDKYVVLFISVSKCVKMQTLDGSICKKMCLDYSSAFTLLKKAQVILNAAISLQWRVPGFLCCICSWEGGWAAYAVCIGRVAHAPHPPCNCMCIGKGPSKGGSWAVPWQQREEVPAQHAWLEAVWPYICRSRELGCATRLEGMSLWKVVHAAHCFLEVGQSWH